MKGWPEPLQRLSRGKSTSVVASLDEDEFESAAFKEKLAGFERAETAFRVLVDKLNAYRKAVMATLELGVDLAQHIEVFFVPPATSTQRELAVRFRQAVKGGHDRWRKKGEKLFEEEVFAPVKGRLDEIPEVRDYIKKRANAHAEWQRRLKKVAAASGKKDRRMEEKRRKCEEARVFYRSMHDEVVQRCTNIERNLGNFISPSLRSLVSIRADHARSQAASLLEVENLLQNHPPMTPSLVDDDIRVREKIIEPSAEASGAENWDTAFSGELLEDSNGDPFAGPEVKSETQSPGVLVSDAPSPHKPEDAKDSLQRDLSDMLDPSSRPVTHVSVATSQTSRASSSSGPLPPDTSSSVLPRVINKATYRGGLRKPSGDTIVSEVTDEQSQNSVTDVLAYHVVLFDFDPQEANEMMIRKNDVVEVLEKNASGWWTGRCKDHNGLFPHNYTRPMTEDEELSYIGTQRERRKGQRRGLRVGENSRLSKESRSSNRSASGNLRNQSSLAPS